MRPLHWGFIIYLAAVEARWQTVFNSNYTIAYIQSVDGSLYRLPITSTNTTPNEVNRRLKKITSAPKNATLILDNLNRLLAVWGSNGCGSAPVEISVYDEKLNQWRSFAQSNIKAKIFYQDSQIVWMDRSEETIYIYGGSCNGETQAGFYKYDLKQNKFSEVKSQGIMPREMAEAQPIALNDYETLIIGGRADGAWMSMQQVAIWGHGSWSFNFVANSTGIDSRDNPLVLPVWEYGQNGTTGSLNEILIIGGTVAGRKAVPSIIKLKYSKEVGWHWDADLLDSSDINVDYAGSTLYSTLVNLDAKTKKATFYGNIENNDWVPVNTAYVIKPTSQTSLSNKKASKSTPTAVIAVVSTLLPIIILCLIGVAIWWFWRRRQERKLFLKPNRVGMLQRQRSTDSGTHSWNNWVSPSPQAHTSSYGLQVIPYEADAGSVMFMDSGDGQQMYMSRQRRNLHVVNPDGSSVRSDDSILSTEKPKVSYQVHSRGDSVHRTREPSWSSNTAVNPFSDNTEKRSDFDFGI